MRKQLIILKLIGLLSAPAMAQGTIDDLSLFCSSGGFLYNRLEAKELDDTLVFSGSGYDHGLNIAKMRLGLDPNDRFRGFSFELSKDECQVNLSDSTLIQCLPGRVDMTFYLYDDKGTISKNISYVVIQLNEESFRIHNHLGEQILGQELRQGCVDLTGL